MIYQNKNGFIVQNELILPSLQIINCSNFRIVGCTIEDFPEFGIVIQNCTSFWLIDNYISITASSNQNEGILLTGTNKDGHIRGNMLYGSGMDLAGKNIAVTDNHVEGWQFGAGITTEFDSGTSDFVIANNMLLGGGGTDVNNTRCLGIETYAPNSTIQGNRCIGNVGCGITVGGPNNLVIGNICLKNGYAGINLFKGNGADSSGSLVTNNLIDSPVNVYSGVSATIVDNQFAV